MVYLAAPSSVAPPVANLSPWVALQHTLVAWDGSEWDLSQGLSGLALAPGIRGLKMPPIIRYSTKAPAVAGSLYRGSVTDEREIFWPLRVFNYSGSQAWLEHNSRFWETMNPDKLNIWKVTRPDGRTRSLYVRFVSLADDSDEGSELFGWAVYGINLIAEDPYWLGDVESRTFVAASGEDYYGGASGGGFGPPYFISPGSTTDDAAITNDGDVAAWPTWTVNGPTTDVTVGLNGHAINFPMDLTGGQWVKLNTDPTNQVAIDHSGSDRTAQLGEVDFAEIPPGTNVPLTITMTGTGTIDVSIRPRYYLGV